VFFLTAPHCQFRGVGQGMKQTYLYLYFKLNVIDAMNEITNTHEKCWKKLCSL